MSSPPIKNPDGAARLRELFAEAGCGDYLSEQKVPGTKLVNIVCTLEGAGSRTLVIGAHYDKVRPGEGVIDNWTGVVMLAALYRSLSQSPRQHRIQFVGFAEEEVGLYGSQEFVRQIPKAERSRYAAMINIDSLGLGPTKVWPQQADPQLRMWLEQVAQSAKLPLGYVDLQNVARGDSTPFVKIKIPVIDFHSITPDNWTVLHTEQDRASALKMDDLWDSYRLLVMFAAFADQKLTPALPVSPQ